MNARPLNRTRVSVPLVLAVAVAAGCANAEDSAGEGGSAVSIGGRFQSPFEDGTYDAANGSISLSGTFTTQSALFTWASETGDIYYTCATDLDFREGKIFFDQESQTAAGEDGTCRLQFADEGGSGKNIAVEGTLGGKPFSRTFVRRREDALQGEYHGGPDRLSVDIGPKGFGAPVTVRRGSTALGTGTPEQSGYDTFGLEAVPNCPLEFTPIRRRGSFTIHVMSPGRSNRECPFLDSHGMALLTKTGG